MPFLGLDSITSSHNVLLVRIARKTLLPAYCTYTLLINLHENVSIHNDLPVYAIPIIHVYCIDDLKNIY